MSNLSHATLRPLEETQFTRSGPGGHETDSLSVVAKRIRYSDSLKSTDFKERQKNG